MGMSPSKRVTFKDDAQNVSVNLERTPTPYNLNGMPAGAGPY